MSKDTQQIEEIKKSNATLNKEIDLYFQYTRQALWFGNYCYHSKELEFDIKTRTIYTSDTAIEGYYSIMLYIPVYNFRIRVLDGNICFGFVTPIPAISLEKSLPPKQSYVMWYDGKYYNGNISHSTFNYHDDITYSCYDAKTRTVHFGLVGRPGDDEAFSNVDNINLYPVISLRKGTKIQLL